MKDVGLSEKEMLELLQPALDGGGMLKTVRVLLHLEATDDGGVAWWAESDDVPGFTAAAPELVDLRRRVHATLADEFPDGVTYTEELVATDPVEATSTAQLRLTTMSDQTAARSVGLRMKQLVAYARVVRAMQPSSEALLPGETLQIPFVAVFGLAADEPGPYDIRVVADSSPARLLRFYVVGPEQ